MQSWQANIYDMLRRIPTRPMCLIAYYFGAIGSKLTLYQALLNEAQILFQEEFGLNHDIVLDILSFL
jgi:hypothetical protein